MTEPILLHDTEFEFVRLADVYPWAVDDTDTGVPYRVYCGNGELGEIQFEAEGSTWSAAPNTPGAWKTLGFANELHAARFLAKFMDYAQFGSNPLPVVGRVPPGAVAEDLRAGLESRINGPVQYWPGEEG